ncbi:MULTISPECIES: hypothetical protein [unclassified Bradyrhizobium]|uniref:hypothetical protein n=1 Tax=unclassified Bradyrhizobium TaxID=2631580 RepID=UPI00291637D8|nr:MULTISPECIES: hypothetical protein [unclassified Bradyrhizobium]
MSDTLEIRAIVAAVLAEQQGQSKAVAEEAAAAVLRAFGLDDEDHRELRADFQLLRRWRKSVEQAQSLTFKAVIGTLVTGFIAVVWMGVKAFLGK